MSERRRLSAIERLESAVAGREAALEVQRRKETALIDDLAAQEREVLQRRSDTIAGLSLELSLAGARLNRLVAEREQALERQARLQETWANTKRIANLVANRRRLLAAQIDRAEQEQSLQDWVTGVHLRKDASSRTDS